MKSAYTELYWRGEDEVARMRRYGCLNDEVVKLAMIWIRENVKLRIKNI